MENHKRSNFPDRWRETFADILITCHIVMAANKLFLNFLLDQGLFCGVTDCSCFGLCMSFLMGFKSRVHLLPVLFLACVQ